MFILIGLFGGYGVVSEWSMPVGAKDVFGTLGVLLVAVLAVRSLRAGVLVDDRGLVSRAEIETRRLPWREIERFDARGVAISNEACAVTVSGKWVRLQYHPYAEDYIKLLEQARLSKASAADLAAAAEATARRAETPSVEQGRPRPWSLVFGLIAMAALLVLVVELDVLPVEVALVIALAGLVASFVGRHRSTRQ